MSSCIMRARASMEVDMIWNVVNISSMAAGFDWWWNVRFGMFAVW